MSKSFDFETTADAEVRAIRRERTGGEPVTYQYGSRAMSLQGDNKFPFFKDPADVSRPEDYLESQTLSETTSVANFTTGPTLDVRGVSTLVLYLLVDPDSSDGRLCLVPQALLTGPNAEDVTVFPIGVVDVTLTTPPTGLTDNGYAARNILQSFIVWDPGAEQSPPPTLDGNFNVVIQFDVSSYQECRFLFGALDADVTAEVWVAAQR